VPFSASGGLGVKIKKKKKKEPADYRRLEFLEMPVYIFVCSFVFTCSSGRESDVRTKQALRSGSVA
jgi:hypothetical protein